MPEQKKEVDDLMTILESAGYKREEEDCKKEIIKEKIKKMKITAIEGKRVAAQMMLMAKAFDKIVDSLQGQFEEM